MVEPWMAVVFAKNMQLLVIMFQMSKFVVGILWETVGPRDFSIQDLRLNVDQV